jgi:hypothetical protein
MNIVTQAKSLLNYVVHSFGFEGVTDFSTSFFHSKLLLFTLPSSIAIYGVAEKWFGFSGAIFLAFCVMAIMELVTGLWGAKAKGVKIESRKFGRFGLKLLVWLSLIFVAHSFAMGYKEELGFQAQLTYQVFSWLHGVLMVYISFEYYLF